LGNPLMSRPFLI